MRKAELKDWEGGILQVSVPMDPPLRWVNSYIVTEPEGGITVIDPGPHTLEAELAWQGCWMSWISPGIMSGRS